jgi:crotonobetainyl-CoA:carnitine CoA-transferase CaiB-like acyl-CoA transferase
LEALIASCNAVVESGRPQELLSARLGRHRLQALRPDVVLVSITPFGEIGPYSAWRGGDLEVSALSGLAFLRADPDTAPCRPGAEQTAHMASLLAANAALLGLFHQQSTGQGSYIEVAANFVACLATLQSGNANYYTWLDVVPIRRSAVYQVWPVKDGWTTYTASPRAWPKVVELLKAHGAEVDLEDPSYAEPEARQEHLEHINEVVGRFFLTRGKQELFRKAQTLGLRWMPVNTVADITKDPFLIERGFFREVDWPALGGKITFPGPPFRFGGRDLNKTKAPPEHGEHTAEVFAEIEGASKAAGPVSARRVSSPPAKAASPDTREPGPWLPLKGIRVLDFSWLIAGPLGTRLLANFGAEVLKVESYNRVDGIRLTGPHVPTDGPVNVNEDGSFNDVNLGKKSILLNLNVSEAREIALKLAAVSDIVAANFTADRLDRWGLGFEALRKVKPDIIFLSMPVFAKGERVDWGGVGSDISAISGVNAISGYEGSPPIGMGLHYPDFSSNPFHAQAAILSALLNRKRFGEAQLIEVSQYESTVSILGPALLNYFVNGEESQRLGNRSDRSAPHNIYRCAGDDRWCAISARTEEEWRAMARVLGHVEWADDRRFRTVELRKANEGQLDELISGAVASEDAWDLAARLQGEGAAAAPVNNVADLLRDFWYRREYFTEMQGPEGCQFTSHGEPLRPQGRKHEVIRAPTMGEHTEEVLRGILGLTDIEIDSLYVAGALG